MTYWVIAAGTSPNAVGDDWWSSGAGWRRRHGNTYMFGARARITTGDRLVHYAVGSPQTFGKPKFYAVSEVVSPVEPSGHERWPWQVGFEYVIRGPLLRYCPSLDEIEARPPRSHTRLSDQQGREAVRLLERKAPIFGSLGE